MKIREATQLLGMLEGGELAASLAAKLREVVIACQAASGPKREAKGELKLKLKIAVKGQSITLDADIDTKAPKEARASSVFFVTQDGEIDTDHPQQLNMFPRDAGSRGTA